MNKAQCLLEMFRPSSSYDDPTYHKNPTTHYIEYSHMIHLPSGRYVIHMYYTYSTRVLGISFSRNDSTHPEERKRSPEEMAQATKDVVIIFRAITQMIHKLSSEQDIRVIT